MGSKEASVSGIMQRCCLPATKLRHLMFRVQEFQKHAKVTILFASCRFGRFHTITDASSLWKSWPTVKRSARLQEHTGSSAGATRNVHSSP